jgi:hypothetical protein
MGTAIFNLIVGALTIAAGLSGKFTFVGTQSSTILLAVGVGIALLGLYQLIRHRR